MKIKNKFRKANIYIFLTFVGMIPYWTLKESLGTVAFISVYLVYALIIKVVAEKFGRGVM